MDRHHLARRRLKLRQLEILLAVAATGSMAKAATRLAISQPGISRAIADAEHTLGVPLFDRSTQGVEPTQYGRALLKRGIAAFDEIDQGVKDIEFLTDPATGEVRIGSIVPLATTFVSAVVSRLSQRYPRMVFQFVTEPSSTLHRELSERNLDLVIARKSVTDEQLSFEFLFDDLFVVVAGAQSPWARRRKIALA